MLAPNTPAALDFLKNWNAEGPWVLTAIHPETGKIATETFTSLVDASVWIDERQGKWNLYFTVNPVTGPLKSKPRKTDIKSMAWLHVDVDPRVGEDIERERIRAIKALQAFEPKPTVIVDSGGGYQGFWRLETPIPLGDNIPEMEAYNQQLEIMLGGDHCFNVDRIMRLPGSINVPNAQKKKKGRTEALASVVEANWDVSYDLKRFTPAANVQTADSGSEKVAISGNLSPVDLDDLPASVTNRTKMLIVQGGDPDDPTKYASRSEVVFAVCCQLVRAGCEPDTIASILMDPGYEISASVREKPRPEKYAARQIERAMEEAIDPWLRILNEEYAVIMSDAGGKCRVVHEEIEPALNRPILVRQTIEDFKNAHRNMKITVGKTKSGQPIEVAVGTWWLDHAQRRQYKRVVFSPGKEVPNAYNLWKGFNCEALPGHKHESFLKHIHENICGGVDEYYQYVVGWMARAVQQPDRPGETAIVLRGKRGTGKSFFAKKFGALFGRHYLQVSDSKHLVGSFNAHLRDCVVLFGDEAFFAGDKKHESVLKTLITEDTLAIEAKGVDVVASPNYTHLILASNDDWVVPAGAEERRFLVLDVLDTQMQNSKYFDLINKDLSSGGLENLLFFLKGLDLSDFNVRNAPKTAALQEQKMYTMSVEEQWWFECLQNGTSTATSDEWQEYQQVDFLYESYLEYATAAGYGRRQTMTSIGRFLSKACPPQMTRVQRMGSKRQPDGSLRTGRAYFYQMPGLEKCREHFDKNFGGPFIWPKVEGVKVENLETPF